MLERLSEDNKINDWMILYSRNRATDFLGVYKNKFGKMVDSGEITSYYVNGKRYFWEHDLALWLYKNNLTERIGVAYNISCEGVNDFLVISDEAMIAVVKHLKTVGVEVVHVRNVKVQHKPQFTNSFLVNDDFVISYNKEKPIRNTERFLLFVRYRNEKVIVGKDEREKTMHRTVCFEDLTLEQINILEKVFNPRQKTTLKQLMDKVLANKEKSTC